jgi:hypothetical protein
LKLKNIVAWAALLLVSLPFAAHAMGDGYCGTAYPKWWWKKDDLQNQLNPQNWSIDPVGAEVRISFQLVNTGTTTFNGPVAFTLTHAAVDPRGFENPGVFTAPADPRALLGTEALTTGTVPSLRPGEAVTVYATARSFRTDANHIVTLSFHDGTQVQIDPQPNPWYWLRVQGPSGLEGKLRFTAGAVTPVGTTLPGYRASRIQVILRNESRDVLRAGLPILVTHSNAASAGGNYSPDQPVDPNDPGNPYAIYFRETLFDGRLSRDLSPGEFLMVEGTALIPDFNATIEQVAVKVGE